MEDTPPPRKRRLRKLLLGGALALLGVLVIGRAAAPGIVRARLEQGATERLGLPVTIADVDLGLLAGGAAIKGMQIADPLEGAAPLLDVARASADISWDSLFGDLIVVNELALEGTTAVLRRDADGRQNLQVLLERLRAPEPEAPEPAPEEAPPAEEPQAPAASERGILVQEIRVRDFRLILRDDHTPALAEELEIGAAELLLSNVGLPAPGQELADPLLAVELRNLSFKLDGARGTGTRFQNPEFFNSGELRMTLNLQQAMRTREKAPYVIPDLRWSGFTFSFEELEGDTSYDAEDNLALARTIAQAVLQPPQPEETEATPGQQENPAASEPGPGLLDRLGGVARQAGSALSEARTAEPAPAPAPESPAPEDLPFAYVRVDHLELIGGTVHFVDHGNPDQSLSTTDIGAKGSALRFPYQQGEPAELAISASPLEPGSRIEANLAGDFLDAQALSSTDLRLEMTNLALAPADQFASGYLTGSLASTIRDRKVEGLLTFTLRDLRLEDDAPFLMKTTVEGPLRMLYQDGQRQIAVPLNFHLDQPTWRSFAQALGRAVMQNMGGALEDAMADVRKQLDGLAEQAQEATNALTGELEKATGNLGTRETNQVTETLEKGTQEVDKAAEKLRGAVGSLFGGNKED